MKRRGPQPNRPRGERAGAVLGRDWFDTISAIEGIKLSPRAKKRAADHERQGLSHDERRREIARAYRKG